MVALTRAALAGFLAALSASAAIAQTVTQMPDASIPLTNQEYLYIVQNGQPRRVHPGALGPPGLVVPTADLLGGVNGALNPVTVGPNLSFSASTLSMPVPTADILGGTGNAFDPIAVGSGLLLSGGALSAPVATSSEFGIVKPDNTTVTISDGVLSAAAGCGIGLTLGTVLFADGSDSCTGDAARLFWNTTTDTAAGHILFVTGGNLFGHVVNLAADQAAGGGWNPALSTLFLGANNSDPTAPYGLVGTWGPLAAPLRTSINPDGGTVAIDAGSSTLGLADPVALLINNHSADAWTTAFGSALAFRGGVWNKNTHDADTTATELRLWSGPTERARISAALAGTSMVPNRFTAAGITDNTTLSCNGTNNAIQTDASGNLACGSISGGGGGVTASSSLTTHGIAIGSGAAAIKSLGAATNGQIPIGSTGADPVLATIAAGAGVTVTNGVGSITIASAGGGVGNGLYQSVMSAVPTQSGTGLTTSTNLGTATPSDGLTGFNICGATNAGQIEGKTKTAPATPYNIDVAIQNTQITANSGFGPVVGWYDGTKLQVFMVVANTSSLFVLDYATVGSGAGASTVRAGLSGSGGTDVKWLRLKNDGTTVSFQVAPGGDYSNAQTIYSVAIASGNIANYNKIFYGINANNGALCGTLLSYTER